jgi:hypothetical protein
MRRSMSRPPRRQRDHARVTYVAAPGAHTAPALFPRQRPEPRDGHSTATGLGPYEMTYDISFGYGTDRSILLPGVHRP